MVKHGIDHLFQVGDLDGARERLLDLYFFDRLYEMVEYPQILRYWRALGDESAADQYQRAALELLENDDFEFIKDPVYSAGNFCHQAYWLLAGIAIFRRLTEKSTALFGPDHPDTLSSLMNLASCLDDQGNYEEAEAFSRQALEGRQQVLGPDHPDTFDSLNNLANCLHDQGNYEAAEAFYRQVLEGREQVLGPSHPNTFDSLYNLALFSHMSARITNKQSNSTNNWSMAMKAP